MPQVKYYKTTAEKLAEQIKLVSFTNEYEDFQRDADGKIMNDADGEALWTSKVYRPTTFIDKESGAVIVSAEDGAYFADYYGEYRGGYPWIHPDLEKFAKDHDLMIEWQNPGAIGFYPN